MELVSQGDGRLIRDTPYDTQVNQVAQENRWADDRESEG